MKLATGRQIYLASETRKQSEKCPAAALGGGAQHVDAVVTADGMFPLRGSQEDGADKFRITVELAQVVWQYFDSEKDPVWGSRQELGDFPRRSCKTQQHLRGRDIHRGRGVRVPGIADYKEGRCFSARIDEKLCDFEEQAPTYV